MFSRKFSNTIRKKKRLMISAIISLILILGIGYASFYSDFSITGSLTVSGHYEPTLYNVLRQEATFGTVARKYTGSHADSMDPSKSTKDIYHWYSTNQQEGFQIIQKNNVIFANHCWKMIRTTDTGGVKLLYNGEAEDDKCLTSRGQHLGYTSSTTLTLSDNYWYGTDYTYDKNNRNYTLSGTTEQAYWDNNTAPNLIGKYTCQRLNLSDTCTSLFYITDVYDNTQARAIMFGDYLNYSTFGNIEYNTNGITPAYAGYMYNKTYERIENNLSQSATTLTSSYMDQNNTYYFGTGISYDPNNDEYTLTGTVEKVWRNYLNDSKGMYTCKQSTAAPCSTVYYISGGDSYYLYGLELTGGNLLTDVDREIKFSSSYSESNGVYTLDSPETVTLSNWVSNYTKYSKYFTCGDNNTSCNNLQYVSSIGKTSYSYYEVNNNFIYSNSFTYDGTKYILDTNNSIQAYDLSDTNVVNSLKNKKYTCYNTTGECQQLYYKVSSYSIILENGESITDALNTMLKADDVNQKSSTIKMAVDAWYKKYMLAYSNMLEDTVFCNNRNISDLGNFDPNKTYGNLTFSEFDLSTDLSCSNITDRFSTNNTKAQLTYPVGIISAPEAKLFGDSNSLKEGSNYRTLTPYQYVINNNDYVTTYFINTYGGNFSESNVTNTYGVRPVISLKPNTKYTTGDGSFATPYVVDMST